MFIAMFMCICVCLCLCMPLILACDPGRAFDPWAFMRLLGFVVDVLCTHMSARSPHCAQLWECGCFGDGPQQRDADGAVPPSNAAAAAVPLSCELQPWEAAFLALELGCLTVRRGGAALDGGAVRRALCATGAADALYAVYSHLRWKHWCARCLLEFLGATPCSPRTNLNHI